MIAVLLAIALGLSIALLIGAILDRKRFSIVVSPPPIEEALLLRALATDIEGVPMFQAVMQVIAEHEQQCISGAIGSVADHGIVSSEVGGIQVLRELREKLLELRAQGQKG